MEASLQSLMEIVAVLVVILGGGIGGMVKLFHKNAPTNNHSAADSLLRSNVRLEAEIERKDKEMETLRRDNDYLRQKNATFLRELAVTSGQTPQMIEWRLNGGPPPETRH